MSTATRKSRGSSWDAAEFDPATVPVFPVLTVEIVEDRELLIDGRVEPIPPDTTPTNAAVAAAAEAVRRRGLDHCRISAVVDGTTYPLVVGADGSRYDISSPAHPRRKSGSAKHAATGRAWVLPAAVMVFALLAAGVVIATVKQFGGNSGPAAVATVAAPSPTELPVLAPDGWSTHASWSVPVANRDRAAIVATDGYVLAVTDDDTLTTHDAATGVVLSQTNFEGGTRGGPLRTTVDGQNVVAMATTRYLYWWPDPRNLTDTRRVRLEPRAEVTFAGPSPLITLPGQHAATIVDGTLSDRTVPAGAAAIRADGSTITAVDSAGRLWQLDQTQVHVPAPIATLEPVRPGQLPTLLGSAGSYLILSWRNAGGSSEGSLTIANLRGDTVASRNVPALKSGDDWTASHQTAVTAGHVFTFVSPRIVPIIDTSWRTQSIVDTTIYGTTAGQDTATLSARSGKVTTQANAEAVPPAAVDAQHAYVTADTPDGPILYALQRD